MKNGILIWNVVLTLLVGFLVTLHFTGRKGSKGASTAATASDSLVGDGKFRMAYFEMDSLEANFNLVKEWKADLGKREQEISNEMANRGKAFQQKYNFYQEKSQSGTMSQDDMDNASKELKAMDDEMKNRKQQLDQEYNNYVMTKQSDIKSKIEAFIKQYNEDRRYSYIVSLEPGLFYYRDTVYNITKDVVKGLNEMYPLQKK